MVQLAMNAGSEVKLLRSGKHAYSNRLFSDAIEAWEIPMRLGPVKSGIASNAMERKLKPVDRKIEHAIPLIEISFNVDSFNRVLTKAVCQIIR